MHRREAGLTQEQLAEQLNVGNETVSRIERGVILPSLVRLTKIADILNCHTETLLGKTAFSKQDQLSHLAELVAQLDRTDREWLIGFVETLMTKLKVQKGTG